ncbi:MAG: zinc-dependent metalloprotease, partial [Bacteroidetes bacterium]|nr:zinc-dependent metalloprotease [Bacteroidota bacterium]
MTRNISTLLFFAASFIAIPLHSQAQIFKKKKTTPAIIEVKEATVVVEKEKDDGKSISSITRKCKKYDGLFNVYQDTTTGTIFMLIKKQQLNKEFIYFSHTVDGVASTGHHRGGYRDNKIFTIKKYYNKIEFVAENTNYYFDEKSPLSRASEANISTATLLSLPILASNKDQTEFLVRADDIFLTESLHQVKPSTNLFTNPGGMSLGSQSKDKTKVISIKSYPENTDVVAEYVYDNPSSSPKSKNELADGRSVSIKMQHSLVEVPQNSFRPRQDDPRVGYFSRQVNDMTSTSATPYKDVIQRWHLIKKEPNEKLSEPIEPIVWWLENTTPHEYRETIKAAVLAWNEAFEVAGFKNAIQVKVQPDDAEWDAGDIRYNVLRWASSPSPSFGGYGPSFVNPRTGQIIGADIMFEFIYLTNRIKFEKLFNTAGIAANDGFEEGHSEHLCSAGDHLHMSTMFGMSALASVGAAEVEKEEYIKQSLYYLILHEVGHTLGLNHNMKASQLYSPEDIHNKELTGQSGLTSSVMDYPSVNIALDKEKQGHYFTMKPGAYDKWAIEYGYSESLVNQKEEKQRLRTILARSVEPELMFGNDADDMRSVGKGIDPRVMIGDMSNDVIRYASERIQLSDKISAKLLEKYGVHDESYHQLRNAYLVMTTEVNNSASAISRYIGGIYVDRSFVGQSDSIKPFTPVAHKDQKRAMDALSKHIFGPNAFASHANMYSFLQMQRRGFNFMGSTEDPKIHDRILLIQKNVLAHVMHPVVLQRITDSELYGNTYKISEVMNDLTKSIFKDDLSGSVNT